MAEFCHAARDQSLPAGNQRRVARGSVGMMAEPDNEHLAAMRVEYGSVEKDGSPDLDVDWLADGWLALLRKWIGDAER
ncbi:MAG: hypothetical protein ACLQI9_22410, partial [Mycobacterium sp.]